MIDFQQRFIRGAHNLHAGRAGSVVTIGSYDGVHRGHQAVVSQLQEKSRELGLPSVAVIFEPQPYEYFSQEKAPARLMTFREKLLALYDAGVDRVCCLAFNQSLQGLSAQQFVQQILVEGLNTRYLVVGDDFRFGCDRSGDFGFLQRSGAEFGFQVTDTRTYELGGERVSSTRIRALLESDQFAEAERLLGRPYTLSGRIGYGQQLARQWNVPTANVQLRRYRSPLQGVFAVSATLADGRQISGVANVGVRPTLEQNIRPILEVHLLDFEGDLYGQCMQVAFLHKLRNEQKFDSLEALRQQILADVDAARRYFETSVGEG